MKMNHELVRLLMLEMRDDPRLNGQQQIMYTPTTEGFNSSEIKYHLRLIADARFLLEFRWTGTGILITNGLSWTGQGFVDSIRSETAWTKAKELAAKTIGGASLSVLSDLTSHVAKNLLGLAP